MALAIEQFPCRSDNFGVLIHDPASGLTASIDAPEEAPIARKLAEKNWRLNHILTTHHHADHVDGNLPLKSAHGCKITGPAGEASTIPGLDDAVSEGDTIAFGDFEISVIETPGHTLGHISYWIPKAGVAFVADMLAQHLAHKTVLSILAWALFGVLLWGRWRYGWRGRTAVRLSLIGFAVLSLAYFGSKLVLELILERHWFAG